VQREDALVPAPPAGLRWSDAGPYDAALRPKRARIGVHLFAAAWNFGLLMVVSSHKNPATFGLIGTIAGTFFLYMAVRAIFDVTTLRFAGGRFVVTSRLTPFSRLDVPVADISRFEVATDGDGIYRVIVILTSGPERSLPIDLEGVPLKANWRKEQLFAAPPEHASFVAGRLCEMLDAAKRSGHDTYRT
jgi:hypothetical protein